MFSREELFEYFSEHYSQEQIVNALVKLAESDSTIDPSAEEFPASITERLEQVFKVIEDAIALARAEGIASDKQLTGTSDLAQIEQTAINLASDRAIAIPIDAVRGLIEILETEAIVEAVALHEQKRRVRDSALLQLEANSLIESSQLSNQRIEALNKLIRNPEKLDQILEEHGFLTTEEAGRQHAKLTASCSLDFDVDAFLDEVNQKKPQPKTIQDTKRLAKALVTRSLRR